MVGIGTFDRSESSATYTIDGLDGLAKFPIDKLVDGTIRSYDGNGIFYVHFKTPESKEDVPKLTAEIAKWREKENNPKWETDQGKLALYKTVQSVTRVAIMNDKISDSFKVFNIDTGETHENSHRNHLYKMPSNLKKFAPEAVPVSFEEFKHGDFFFKPCLDNVEISIRIKKEEKDGFPAAENIDVVPEDEASPRSPLIQTLKDGREFKKNGIGKDAELTCCFGENGICPQANRDYKPVDSSSQAGLSHGLLTLIVVGSVICAIIIVLLAAVYIYKRFGHVISERHRRHHHGHKRNRNESPPNCDLGSPSSSQRRDPLPMPIEDVIPPFKNDNVITRLPQHNISTESPHHTQVNRTINPMVQENSGSPNRAMTPLKTAEMATQTHTCSATRSAEPVPDDDISSTMAQPSDSRMAAGSSSDLSEVTLQPSIKSSHRYTLKSTDPPSQVSSFVIGKVKASPLSPQSATITRINTTNDYMNSAGPTMAEDVIDSDEEEDEDEDSVTRSVDDCERVLAAYKPPRSSLPAASSAAHRTESHLSTRPGYSTSPVDYTDYRDSNVHNRASRPHLISLPTRSSHREERRRNELEMGRKANEDFSHLSVPTDLLTPRSNDTLSSLHTAIARRESTVSWMADRTQSSMGRSMNEEEISL